MEKLKEFYKKNKKKCLTAAVLVVAGIVYCVWGQELGIDGIVDQLCLLTGGCE